MIFRKFLCGGFGILMFRNDQVEKNLAFQCCAKLVWWLHLRSAPHIKPHQITTLNVWRYTVVSIVADAVWGCLGESEGESWCIWVVFYDVKTAWESLRVIWGFSPCRIEPCWSQPTILAKQWNERFGSPDHYGTSKYQNSRIKAF